MIGRIKSLEKVSENIKNFIFSIEIMNLIICLKEKFELMYFISNFLNYIKWLIV